MKQLVILIFCFCSLSLVSQNILFEGEIGLASFDVVDSTSTFTPTFGMGIHYDQSISDYFSASVGLKFMNKGTGIETAFGTVKINLYYLEIPLLFRANIPFKQTTIHPEFGFYWSKGLQVVANINDETIDDYTFGESGLNSGDRGLNFGIGFTLNDLLIMGRYSHGLSDINADEDIAWKNRVFSISFRGSPKLFKKDKS